VCCQQDMARCPWFFPTRLVPHRTPRATRGATQAPPKFERRGRPALLGIRAAFPPLWERWRAAHPTGGWVLHTTPSDVCAGLRQSWSLAGFSSRPPRLILVALTHVPGAVSNAQVPICLLFSDPAQAGATSRSASRRARCFRNRGEDVGEEKVRRRTAGQSGEAADRARQAVKCSCLAPKSLGTQNILAATAKGYGPKPSISWP
jgi:hypothetical protein